MNSSDRRFYVYLLLIALLTIALHTAGAYRVIFPEPGLVRFLDIDSYFHTRHSLYVLHHFPHLLRHDMAVEFPRGQRSDAAGLFDLGIAGTTILITGGHPTDLDLLKVAAWTPVALGTLAIVVLGLLSRRYLSPRLSYWPPLILTTCPSFYLARTVLGFADHHAAEILLSLLVISGLALALGGTSGEAWAIRAARSFVGSIPQVIFLFLWTGGALFVPIAMVGLALLVVAEVLHGVDPRATTRGAGLYGTFVIVTTWAISWLVPEAVMEHHALEMAWLASGYLALMPVTFHALARRLLDRGWTRAQAAATMLMLFAFSIVLPLTATHEGRNIAKFLLTAKTVLIREHVPIDLVMFFHQLGFTGLMAALALPLLIAAACFEPAQRERFIPAGIGSVVCFLWLVSHDYGYQAPPMVALLAALTASLVWPPVVRRFPKLGHPLASGAILAALLMPPILSDWFLRPYVTESLARSMREVDPGWEEAMTWLRAKTAVNGIPPQPLETPAPAADPTARLPPYGIACAWDRGNFINALGNRWPVFSRFPTKKSAGWFPAVDEKTFLQLLCPASNGSSQIRYVVMDAQSVSEKFMTWVQMAGLPTAPYRESARTLRVGERVWSPADYGTPYCRAISTRLYYTNGDGLEHLRLVFASQYKFRHFYRITENDASRVALPIDSAESFEPPIRPGISIVSPQGIVHDVADYAAVKIFEVVPGATLTGLTAPGAMVKVELDLELGDGSPQAMWTTATRAGAGGRFAVRVPYSTVPDSYPSAVRTAGRYRVIAPRPENIKIVRYLFLPVTEKDVQSGASINVTG